MQGLRPVFWLWLTLLAWASASAQEPKVELSPDAVRLADVMQYAERARQVLTLSLQQAIDGKRAPAKDMQCLKAIDFKPLRDMYAEVFTSFLPKDETATAIALFTSPPGKKLLRRWQAEELRSRGLPHQAPGELSSEEQGVLDKIRAGLAGRILTPSEDVETQDRLGLQARGTIARLIAGCAFAAPVQWAPGALRLAEVMQLADHTRELYQRAAQRAVDQGQASAEDMACLKSVDFEPLNEIYADVFTQKLSKEEITAAIDFFSSSIGKLYLLDVQARNLSDFGYPTEGPSGKARAEDREQFESFARTSAGAKLIEEEIHETPVVRGVVSRVAAELSARCVSKK